MTLTAVIDYSVYRGVLLLIFFSTYTVYWEVCQWAILYIFILKV